MIIQMRHWKAFASFGVIAIAASCGSVSAPAPLETSEARFSYLTYSGTDPIFDLPVSDSQARNPILAGYYPDPSIVKVDAD